MDFGRCGRSVPPFFTKFAQETCQFTHNQDTTNSSQSSKSEVDNSPVTIAQVIDILAYEYGWSVDTILSLSKDAIKLIVDAILERRKKEKEYITKNINSNSSSLKNFTESGEEVESYDVTKPEADLVLLNEGILTVVYDK
ncbi:MAG: hypothetical protein QXM53_04655 [Thermofilaceae archaeon]